MNKNELFKNIAEMLDTDLTTYQSIKQVRVPTKEEYKKLTKPYDIVIDINVKPIDDIIGVSILKATTEGEKLEFTVDVCGKLEKENAFYPYTVIMAIGASLNMALTSMDYKASTIEDGNILVLIDNRQSILKYSEIVDIYSSALCHNIFSKFKNLEIMIGCGDDVKDINEIFLEKKKDKKDKKKNKKKKK